jgi:hypothetical protein
MKSLLIPIPKEILDKLDAKTKNKILNTVDSTYASGHNGGVFSFEGNHIPPAELYPSTAEMTLNVSAYIYKAITKDIEHDRIKLLEKEVKELRKLKESIQTIKGVIGDGA